MKKIKKTGYIILLALLVFLGLGIRKISFRQETEALSSRIEENIEQIREISSVKYNYSNLVDYKDSYKISGIKLPFTSKSFLVKYNGYIKAGYDQVQVSLDPKTRKARVNLGQAKILDNVINEEDVYFYNERDSVFNPLKFDNLYEILRDEKEKSRQEALDRGILKDAQDNAQASIEAFLESLGISEIEFI